MKSSAKAFFALALVLAICLSVRASTVHILTSDNYNDLTSDGKWLIDFFAPWCPHCQQLEPVFLEAAGTIAKQYPAVKLGTVDCTTEADICTRLNIEGYPTLKYVRKGTISDYEGGREASDFVSWAKVVTGPATTKLKGESQVSKFKTVSDISFVLYSRSESDIKAYTEVAEIYQDMLRFGVAKGEDLVEKGKYKVTWFNDGEPESLTGEAGELHADMLKHWVLDRKYPHFVDYEPSSWTHFASLGKPLLIVAGNKVQDKSDPLVKALRSISLHNSNYVFGLIDGQKYASFVSSYVDSSAPRPTFFVLDTQKQVYWHNSSLPHKKKALEVYLDGIASGEIPSTSTAMSGINRIISNVMEAVGGVLEDPVLLGVVAVVFLAIVCSAVWFLSSSATDDLSEGTTPSTHKATVTIEKPSSDPHSDKLKKD